MISLVMPVAGYQAKRQRMIAIEPLTENLLSRSGELQRLLQSALSPQPDE